MNTDNGLLGFLQRKSLFQSDYKQPNRKKVNSKSNQNRDGSFSKVNQNVPDENDATRSFFSPKPRLYSTMNHQAAPKQNLSVFNNFSQQKKVTTSAYVRFPENKLNSPSRFPGPTQSYHPRQSQQIYRMAQGAAMLGVNFESARVESAQCLQTLSFKLSTQISNINFKIDEFQSNLGRTLNQELRKLRQKLQKMVEEACRQAQRTVKQHIKIQEQQICRNLLDLRSSLQKQCSRIDTMKAQINQPQWRQIAGQILSTELEKKVQNLIRESNNIVLQPGAKIQWSSQKLSIISQNLRQLVKVKS